MADAIDRALLAYLKKHVDADEEKIQQAVDSHKVLRDRLQAKCEEDASLPVPYTDGLLFGSLVRKTKRHPMDDADFLFLMDGAGLITINNGFRTGGVEGVHAGDNPLLDPKYRGGDGHISSAKVMATLRAVIANSYPRSDVTKDGQAINVWLDAYGFGIDVVPSVYVVPDNGAAPHFYIPLGNGQDGWRSTDPRTDLTAYENGNARLGGLLSPTARLAKTWNDVLNAGRLGNFHMDVLVLKAFPTGTLFNPSLSKMLADFFAVLPTLLGQRCPQLTGFSPDVDESLSQENRRLSIESARRAAMLAAAAVGYENAGQTQKALECWSSVLGEQIVVNAPA